MTYLPPVNGGRINATIGGNTAGVGTLVSTGTLTLAGGNNITLSQNGNAITISGGTAAAGGNNTFGMSSLGNTSGTTGVISGSAVQFAFAGGNNITLSQSINASSATITVSAANQTVQTQNIHNLTFSGNTSGTMAQISSGTATFAGGNNITLSQSGNAVTISGANQSAQTQNVVDMTLAGNTTGTLALVSSGTVTLAGGNNVTLSQSGNALTVSAANQTVQTQNIHNLTLSGNTSGTMAQISSGTLTLAGGNNITLSQSGNAITISAPNLGAGGGVALANSQTTYTSGTANLLEGGGAITIASTTGQKFNFSVPQTSSLAVTGALSLSSNGSTISLGAPAFSAGVSTLGNTSGTTGSASGQVLFAGGNNITLSQSGSGSSATITISAGNQSVQTQNLHNVTLSGNTSGTMAQISSGTLTLAGGNNITLSQSGNAVTISAGNGGGGGIALANSQTTYTSGTANFVEGGGAITIASTTGQSFKVSVPATSSLSATGLVSIATNGSTISIGVPAPKTLSRYEYPEGLFTSLGLQGQGSLSINHMYIPFYVTGTSAKIGGSINVSTNTSATTASANMSLWMGIYTLNGSTLALASSGSANNAFAWSQNGSTTANTSVTGMRQLTVPMSVNMTPGEYWMAAVISSATTASNASLSIYGNAQVATGATGAVLMPIGSGVAAARDAMLFQGIYTAGTSAGPANIVASDINNTSASNVQRANFYNVIFNATY